MDPVSFDDDDVGKPVVNSEGEQIGMIVEVRHGTAYVDPDPGMVDTIKSKLGWEDTDEDDYPLQDGQVSLVTDDEVHLGEL